MLKHRKNFEMLELLELVMQQTLNKSRVSSRHCARHQGFLINKMDPASHAPLI